MFKNLVDFTGFETLAVVTMVFFMLIFVGVVIWAFFLKKKYVSRMENLPLESDEGTTTANKEQE
jgi:cbb3-type cytochrome oxidase subunit 3